jgi:hypothetical protein
LASQVFRQVFVLGIAEGPHFITLDTAAGEIGQAEILEVSTGTTKICEQIENRMLCHTGHAFGATDGIAFDEGSDDLDLFGRAELIHIYHYA